MSVDGSVEVKEKQRHLYCLLLMFVFQTVWGCFPVVFFCKGKSSTHIGKGSRMPVVLLVAYILI